MKTQRQAAILRLVRERRIQSQEQLRELLAAEGISVTQATLSRDIRELRLAKVADPRGGSYYAVQPEGGAVRPPLSQLLPTLLLSVQGVGNLLVAKTPSGSASAVAEALDAENWPGMVGTIAGDNTILIVAQNSRAQKQILARLKSLAGLE